MIKMIDELKKYSLTSEEITECIKMGIITKNIYELVTKKSLSPQYSEYYFRNDLNYLTSNGIKVSFVKNNSLVFDSFYITDFHLICCAGKDPITLRKGDLVSHGYLMPDKLFIIPLELVESISINFERNFKGYIPTKTYTKQKDPMMGAIIGGAIAGPQGAMIGAMSNTGTKQAVLYPGKNCDEDTYSLNIKLKNCNEIIIEDFCKIDLKKHNVKKNEEIEEKNKIAKFLIDRVHDKKITEQEKGNIVNETLSKASQEECCSQSNEKLKVIISLIVIAISVIILCICS